MINLYWGWDCIGGSGGMMGWNVYSAAGAGEEEDLFLSVSWVSYVMFTIFLFNLVRFAGACSCLHSDATWFINVVNASGIGSASSFAVICFKTTSFCCFMSDSDVPLHWQLMGQVKEFPQQLLHLTIQEGRQDVMYQLMVCQASTAVSGTVGVFWKIILMFCVILLTDWHIKLEERWNRNGVSEHHSSIETADHGHCPQLRH